MILAVPGNKRCSIGTSAAGLVSGCPVNYEAKPSRREDSFTYAMGHETEHEMWTRFKCCRIKIKGKQWLQIVLFQ